MTSTRPTRTSRSTTVAPERSSTRSFRGDIQGLRALAVVAVILDHLLAWPSGGFLGVDVFFVISGFIITSLLLRQHDKRGRISFAEFYRKRVKRILPASTAVLLVTVLASWMVFLSGRASAIAWDSIAAFFFVANWRFAATDTDYWAADSAVSPVQHYWSLGVEEQFYVVWPILLTLGLALSLRLRGPGRYRGILTAILVVITVGSFAWAMADTAGNAAVAYFSTLSRAWELGIGALLAVATPLLRRIPDAARPVMAYAGLAVIAYGLFALSSESPIPAPGSAIPVVGAALVIAGGTGGTQRFLWPLTNPVSRYLGDISYSLYLWHFPVIVILAAVSDTAGLGYPIIVLVLTLGLSVLSYHGLEDPIRRSHWLEPGAAARRKKKRARRRPGFGASTGTKVAALGTAALLTVTFISLAVVRQQEIQEASRIAPGPAASGEEDPAVDAVLADGDLGALQGQIRDALGATSWPALDPAIDGLERSAVPVEDGQGCGRTDVANPRSCSFGDSRKPTIMVLGDSTGITLLPTVRAMFEATHHIRGLTFAGCAVMDVPVGLPRRVHRGRMPGLPGAGDRRDPGGEAGDPVRQQQLRADPQARLEGHGRRRGGRVVRGRPEHGRPGPRQRRQGRPGLVPADRPAARDVRDEGLDARRLPGLDTGRLEGGGPRAGGRGRRDGHRLRRHLVAVLLGGELPVLRRQNAHQARQRPHHAAVRGRHHAGVPADARRGAGGRPGLIHGHGSGASVLARAHDDDGRRAGARRPSVRTGAATPGAS